MITNLKHKAQSPVFSPDNSSSSSALSPQPSHKPLRWLVTGGCGFIGTNLIAHLIKENPDIKIRVLDNLSVGTKEDLSEISTFEEKDPSLLTSDSSPHSQLELFVRDIRDFEACLKCCKGVDIVVHLAASTGVSPSVEDPREDMEANIIGTFNLLEAARRNRVNKFIFASSGAPIGECEPPIHEEMAPHPVSPYGASKLAGEAYCSSYYCTFSIETIALRFSNVYGPGSSHKNSVVARFIRQAMRGETLEIYGDGKQTRDFIYIGDLVKAILLAGSVNGIGGEVFQIATNAETTVSEMVDILLPILADSGFKDVKMCYTDPRLGDVRRNFSDTSKARKMLGWRPEMDISNGLKRTLDWFIQQSNG